MHTSSEICNPVFTSQDPEFKNPDTDPPPKGKEIWILQRYGVLIRGVWRDDAGYLAWYPFPKMPSWLKSKLTEAYLRA